MEPGLSNHHHSDYVNTYLTTNARKQQESTSTVKPTIITTKEFDPSSTSDTSTPVTSFPPDLALVSALSKAFLRRIRGLESVRDLFCANEYPESFTGQEAIVSISQNFFFFIYLYIYTHRINTENVGGFIRWCSCTLLY